MSCYDTIATCAATGARAAASDEEHPDPHKWLGPGTDWDQRRAFEWAVLRERYPEKADYCTERIEQLKARHP